MSRASKFDAKPRPVALDRQLFWITGDPKKLKAERTAIRDVLGKITYSLIAGKVCFEKTGDAQLPGYIMTMKNKKWILLDTYPALPCK